MALALWKHEPGLTVGSTRMPTLAMASPFYGQCWYPPRFVLRRPITSTLGTPRMSQLAVTIKEKVLREMAAAIVNNDWQATHDLLALTRSISDQEQKVDIFNNLLVMRGHELHQEVTREIQLLRSPASVPYIRRVLEDGFQMFEYTCSEPGVIAKWFSHALADINTPESIAVIEEFAKSGEPEVAEEMAYRLRRVNA